MVDAWTDDPTTAHRRPSILDPWLAVSWRENGGTRRMQGALHGRLGGASVVVSRLFLLLCRLSCDTASTERLAARRHNRLSICSPSYGREQPVTPPQERRRRPLVVPMLKDSATRPCRPLSPAPQYLHAQPALVSRPWRPSPSVDLSHHCVFFRWKQSGACLETPVRQLAVMLSLSFPTSHGTLQPFSASCVTTSWTLASSHTCTRAATYCAG